MTQGGRATHGHSYTRRRLDGKTPGARVPSDPHHGSERRQREIIQRQTTRMGSHVSLSSPGVMRSMSFRSLGLLRNPTLTFVALVAACHGGEVRRATLGATHDRGAEAALVTAMADSANWASYGRDQTNQRYSPLAQITTSNISALQPAWRYKTGVPHAFEASPIVLDGVMYVSTPLNHVIALDATNGRKLWEHAETLSTTVHCCGPVNRGVAVYGGRVYMGTLDGRLVALEARTVKPAWTVRVADNERAYAIDGARSRRTAR